MVEEDEQFLELLFGFCGLLLQHLTPWVGSSREVLHSAARFCMLDD